MNRKAPPCLSPEDAAINLASLTLQARLQLLLVIPDKLVHLALYFGLGGILARARWGQWDRRVARGAVGSRVHIWCTGRMAPELRARSDSGDC